MAENGNKKPELNLVELGSVLFLVAVLAVVVSPGVGNVQQLARDHQSLVQCQQNLETLSQAVETYRKGHQGRFPQALMDLVTSGQLEKFPHCPASEKQTYEGKGYLFKAGNPGRFTLMCFGKHHASMGLPPNEPLYDSLYGLKPAREARPAGKP